MHAPCYDLIGRRMRIWETWDERTRKKSSCYFCASRGLGFLSPWSNSRGRFPDAGPKEIKSETLCVCLLMVTFVDHAARCKNRNLRAAFCTLLKLNKRKIYIDARVCVFLWEQGVIKNRFVETRRWSRTIKTLIHAAPSERAVKIYCLDVKLSFVRADKPSQKFTELPRRRLGQQLVQLSHSTHSQNLKIRHQISVMMRLHTVSCKFNLSHKLLLQFYGAEHKYFSEPRI